MQDAKAVPSQEAEGCEISGIDGHQPGAAGTALEWEILLWWTLRSLK